MVEVTPTQPAGWLERLARAAIILMVAAMALIALVIGGVLAPGYALMTFVAIAGAALVPWQMRAPIAASPLRGGDIIENAIVSAIVGGYPEPTVLLDRAGRVLAFNRLAAELAPVLRRGEPAQLALRTPEIVAALHRAMATGEAQRTEYYERVPIENWMLVAVTPFVVATDLGKDRYLLMTFHDQTPLRRVEEMRADFVANASHELRTPLAALSGFIDTLQGPARNDAPARERFLAIMAAQAARMARLIDDLLSLSRIELSAHVRPETAIDLVPIVRQVVEGLEALARERQVTIAVEVPAAPVVVPGDRDELLRVVENLIENALKYGASGGRVEIVLSGSEAGGEPEARISVRDFGPGIAPEHLHRLTERFYRVDVGESRAQGGTGLGLSLVKHILSRHRGRLVIESAPGMGATFTACLPLAASRPSDQGRS